MHLKTKRFGRSNEGRILERKKVDDANLKRICRLEELKIDHRHANFSNGVARLLSRAYVNNAGHDAKQKFGMHQNANTSHS
jgi:hypothetical protein